MPDLDLLKFARARDHNEFEWRVAAAMTVQAQYNYEANPPGQSVEAVALTDWVLENPLKPIPMMTAFAATHSPVAARTSYVGGVVDTSEVFDADIKYIVDAKWNVVASKMFGASA